jgi:phosphonate transport system substrate-binding protein
MGKFRKYMLSFLLVAGGTIAVVIAIRTVSDFGRKITLDSEVANQGTLHFNEQKDDSRPAKKTQSRPQPRLRIAIAPVVSPEKSFVIYQEFVDYLASAMDREGVFIVRSTYAEINELLREQRCDAALICTLAYIRGRREFGVNLLAAPVINGDIYYRSLIVVPRDSGDQSLLDLEGKLFASADILSTSGWMYPSALLSKQGKNPLQFFKKHVLTGSHDSSILAVANHEVDGAAVHSIVLSQMPEEIRKKVLVVHASPNFGMPPVVVPKQLDERVKKRLLDVLLKMHKDLRGKKILSSLEIDKFVPVDHSLYASVEELERQWQTKK